MTEDTKKCPFCAEMIILEAVKCKHCGEFLSDLRPRFTTEKAINPPEYKTRKVGVGLFFGILFFSPGFFWFTLRNGHSDVSRVLAFSWLLFQMFIFTQKSDQLKETQKNTPTKHAAPSLSRREDVAQQLKLKFSWSKAGFNNIMVANFTVTNPSLFRIQDIEITCTHFANSGTAIDTNKETIYEVVSAKGKRSFNKVSMGFIHSQATKTSCQISNFKII